MRFADKTVVVTGAGGFIGSALVERLVSEGAHVRAMLRYTSRAERGCLADVPQSVLREVDITLGDVRDFDAVRAVVRGAHAIFHLAALIGIPYSYEHPQEVIDTNVMGTSNVLLAAKELSTLERVVLTSTSEVYGSALRIPIDEDHPLQAQSPYSATKIAADALGISFHRSFGMPVTIVRPFNAYGPRQSARAVIPTIISQALAGKTLQMGTLDTKRDFTFVEDTARGFVAVAGIGGGHRAGLQCRIGCGSPDRGHCHQGGKDRRPRPRGRRGRSAGPPDPERSDSASCRQLEGAPARRLEGGSVPG